MLRLLGFWGFLWHLCRDIREASFRVVVFILEDIDPKKIEETVVDRGAH